MGVTMFGNCFGKEKIILNVDPGIDDAWAILFALGSPEIELLGVTVSFGNIENMTQLTENALKICEVADRHDIPVFAGATAPIVGRYQSLGSELFHGKDGLGNYGFPPPTGKIKSMDAMNFIVQTCRESPGEVILVSVGPLTNIAVALSIEPRLPQLVKSIYVMGGTVLYPGNVRVMSEANVAKDSHAAKQVFAAGFKIVMAGLDVTMRIEMYPDYFDKIKNLGTKTGHFVWQLAQFYLKSMKSTGFPWSPCHDPSAIMAIIHPEIYVNTTDYPVSVYAQDNENDPADGLIMVDRRLGPDSPKPPVHNTTLLMQVNQTRFKDIFFKHIASLP